MGLKQLPSVGPDLSGLRKTNGEHRNKGTMANKQFLEACKRASVEPTRRQASKWNNGKGAAIVRRNQ